jgi:hypothetical protein
MKLVSAAQCRESNLEALKSQRSKVIRVAIYTGPGSSHSWIWLVEALERMAFYDIWFVDETQVGAEMPANALFIPGGDTFRLAGSIGPSRLRALRQWIVDGGKYVGICAGAYLPLSSSLPPLDSFNLVKSRIRNLSRNLPHANAMEEKFSVPYGCSYVFHPIRGSLLVDFGGHPLTAPLYGGPSWEDRGDAECLATYSSFTDDTLFLTEEKVAQDTMIGRPAALRKESGNGVLYLFGPHFEHPEYPASNGVIGSVLMNSQDRPFESATSREEDGHVPDAVRIKELKGIMSNARIMYRGLEGASWRIGQKTWDHEKIGCFINAIWERILRTEAAGMELGLPHSVEEGFSKCVFRMRDIRSMMRDGIDTTRQADGLFRDLAETSSAFFDRYFSALRATVV